MSTLPVLLIWKNGTVSLLPEVEDETAKSTVFVSPLLALIESFAHGDDVPMPTFPPKYAFPVVVAPPLIVSPAVAVPFPIVVDASESNPPLKLSSPENVLISVSSVDDAPVPLNAARHVPFTA